MSFKRVLEKRNILFISQVRISSLSQIPGKAFQEAKNWTRIFNKVFFICYTDTEKLLIKKIDEKLLLIAIPFDTSINSFKTAIDIFKNYLNLFRVLKTLRKHYKIDLIREENLIINGIPTLIFSKLYKIPFMTWLGGFERTALTEIYGVNFFTQLITLIIKSLEFVVLKNSNFVFTVSKEIIEIIELYKHYNFILSPNFIDFNLFYKKEKEKYDSITQRKIIFLYSGRFEQEKGIGNLLKATKILSKLTQNFKLHLIGYGSLEEFIKNYIEGQHLTKFVKYLGKFQLSEIPIYYNEADVFIVPSSTEGLPAALLEAMYSGCACVCTNVGMISHYITDDQNGYIVPPDNPKELAKAMRKLIESPEKIEEFGNRNNIIISNKSKHYLAIHSRIYEEIIKSNE